MRSFKFVLGLLITAAFVLSACGAGGTTTEAGKVVTMIFTQEPDTLNPMYTNMYFSSILHQIFNHWAWEFDENNNPYPVLLTEMPNVENGGLSADGKTITLHLRDDIFWSDGEPITADDFVFTWEMHNNTANIVASSYPYSEVDAMVAEDPQTVVMTFDEPFAAWLFLFHGVIPEHILRPIFDADGTLDNADWNRAPTVSSGPFVFSEWEAGSFLRFVRNEDYWGEPALVDEIFIRIVPDDASQIAALTAGEADFGIFIAYPDIPTLEEAGLTVVATDSGYNEGWYLNLDPETGHPALQDVRVRQALAYGTDRFSICEDLLLGKTVPSITFWDGSMYQDPDLVAYPYDPAEATRLLDEAGWIDTNSDGTRDKDGVELVLRYGATDKEVRMDTQAVVQQELAAIGIGIELYNYDSDTFFAGYGDGGPAATGQLDIMEWSDLPGGYPDPDTAYWLCAEIPTDEYPSGANWQGLCDEELDALFQQQSTQVNLADRLASFYEISDIMYAQVYWLGIWQDPDIWAISGNMQNVQLSGVTPFSNVAEWDRVP